MVETISRQASAHSWSFSSQASQCSALCWAHSSAHSSAVRVWNVESRVTHPRALGGEVGDVPFATILWTEGLSFAGVLSYIYADLIIPPLMYAYREYYGGTFAAILSGMIFVAAVISGLAVYLVFAGLGLIPSRAGTQIAEVSIELNYKAVLNVLATILFAFLYYLHRESHGKKRD